MTVTEVLTPDQTRTLRVAPWLTHDVSAGRLAYVPAIIILVVSAFASVALPYSPIDIVGTPNLTPSAEFWFGTDASGFDVFSRTIASFQNDVLIGLSVTVFATVFGIAVGIVVGMNESKAGVGGWAARTLGRSLDLFEALPVIVFSLAVVSFFGANILVLVCCIGLALLPNQARVVRSEVLKVRQETFIESARVSGYSEWSILFRNIVPNVSWPALANSTLMFGASIFIVAALGFLGVGLRPPTPEWGSMISIAAPGAAVGRWWAALFPALALALTVLSFSIAGQRLFRPRHL